MNETTLKWPARLAAALIVAGGGTAFAQEPADHEAPPDQGQDARSGLQDDETSQEHWHIAVEPPGDAGGEHSALGTGADPEDDETSLLTDESQTSLSDNEPPEQQLQRYFQLYREALNNKAYAEADMLAKRVVELSIRIFGVNSLDSARALTNLGIAQHQNDEYEAAIANYTAAIEIIERVEDRLNANLVNPLKGLGAAQLAAGQPDLAVESFDRAVHVSHVNEGPHNLEQLDILESLAETYLSIGAVDEVKNIQEHIFHLQARDVELDSLEAIPALQRQASWQHRLQLYEQERYTWRKVIDIIEDRRSDKDLSLIHPLTELGKSYLFLSTPNVAFHQPTSISSGEIYLKRALRIAEENSEATWKDREGAMLALGDFYILSGKPSRARKIYSETWELLSGDEEKLKNRHDHLEMLVVLQDIYPPRYVGIDGEVRRQLPGDNYQTGKIVYGYSVSARGLTTGISMVEAEPAGFADMERAVLSNLRAMVHRPRLVEGNTVQTDDLTFTHKFFYRQSDLEQMQQNGEVASTNQ